jgi:hypothetical protein
MTEQRQDAGEGALAVQSGRDTNVHQGLSASEMKDIISELTKQMLLPMYTEIARAVVEERLKDFELRVLQRFADDESARPSAFAEPDFQATVMVAQQSHARSGDDEVRDVLVDLIARRSAETTRTRLSLCLNQAVEKAANLTHEEFAALSLTYMLKYVQMMPPNFDSLVKLLRESAIPFVIVMPTSSSVFGYLQAQGLATASIASNDLYQILRNLYAGLISKGWSQSDWETLFDRPTKDFLVGGRLLVKCLHDQDRIQLDAVHKAQFEERARTAGGDSERIINVWGAFESTLWDRETLITRMEQDIPECRRLFEIWESSGLSQATLTSVGIAIAHANVTRVAADFKADLSIWIK